MMQRAVSAIVLCVLVQGAWSQTCVAPSASPANIPAAATPAAAHPSTQPPARAELIKTAAAGTRDDVPPVASRPRMNDQQDHPRRGGTAMLLAALALMSGIALRRYGANNA